MKLSCEDFKMEELLLLVIVFGQLSYSSWIFPDDVRLQTTKSTITTAATTTITTKASQCEPGYRCVEIQKCRGICQKVSLGLLQTDLKVCQNL